MMIDFAAASAWHKIFALHLDLLVEGVEQETVREDTVGDDSLCRLGRWILSEGRACAALPHYQTLREEHRRFHACADEMLSLYRAGNRAEARELRETCFEAASRATIDALAAMQEEYAAAAGLAPAGACAPRIDCDESLRIGVPVIDAQHHALIDLANRLAAQPADADLHSEAVTDILATLGQAMGMHFDTEETVMRRAGMPAGEIAAHAAEHTRILADYAELNRAAMLGTEFTVARVFGRVQEWLLSHLVAYDLRIREHLAR